MTVEQAWDEANDHHDGAEDGYAAHRAHVLEQRLEIATLLGNEAVPRILTAAEHLSKLMEGDCGGDCCRFDVADAMDFLEQARRLLGAARALTVERCGL